MTDNAESYELTSGLPDDFDCEVVDAWFATDSRYNNGNTTLLFWKIETDEDMPDEQKDGGIRFSCGADWESQDGGVTVEHPKGKGKYGNQSAIGVLITKATELGARDVLIARGKAQEAAVWTGTRWHMKREAYEYTIQGGEKKTGERLLPNAFLGTAEGGAPGATGADAQPAHPDPSPSVLDDLAADLVATLKTLKQNNETHAAFVDAAMELTDVTGNTTLVMALATPDGVYSEL